MKVCHSHQGHSEQTWKESQRRKGKVNSVRRKLQLNNPTKRGLIKQKKNKQLTLDETLFFDSLSARFKPRYNRGICCVHLTDLVNHNLKYCCASHTHEYNDKTLESMDFDSPCCLS